MQINEEEIWSSISDNFDEFCDELRSIKMEKKEHAIKSRNKDKTIDKGLYWYDPEISFNARSWLQIPFNPAHDGLGLEEKRNTALKLAKVLKPSIANRIMTAQFVRDWGIFCEYAGQWRMAYLQERPNLNHMQGGVRKSQEQHRIWYAKLFLALRQTNEKRAIVDERVLSHIRSKLELQQKPEDFPSIDWLKEIINFDENGFTRSIHRMPIKSIEKNAQLNDPELPSLGL